MNFKVFVDSTIYYHFDASCVMMSSESENFCLFECWMLLFKTAADMPLAWWCHQNQKIFVCLNAECFCLKLLLTCLLRDDVIKTRKFVFNWMVIAPFCLINFRWHEFLDFCGNNHVIYEPIIPWMLIAHWRLQIRDISLNVRYLYLSHKLFLTWNSNFL